MSGSSGLQAALSALTSQIQELDVILAGDPDNAEITALRCSIQAEVDLFQQDALELRKRQLLSSYADSASGASDDSEPELSVRLSDTDDDDEEPVAAAAMESSDFKPHERISNEFCSWMTHTKGIGLKLLQKHGYVFGAGLGKRQQGRVEPVDIVRRRPKAGLDFGAKATASAIPKAVVADADPEPDVFDFLNTRLNPKNAQATKAKMDLLSEDDCQKNLLDLGGAIAANVSERDRVAAALSRCDQQKNETMVKLYSARLQKIDGSLNQLQTMLDVAINTRKKQRSAMKMFKF